MQAVDLSREDIHTYLARHQKKELLRFLTCGSVDDGKSTLIGRLLHDTKMIYEDQLAAVKRDSVKVGTTGGEIDLALLTDADSVKSRNHFGWTLLHMSAFGGNVATTELLIKKGAAIEARAGSKFRNTPLQTALLSNQYATAKVLLDHGADALVRQSKG